MGDVLEYCLYFPAIMARLAFAAGNLNLWLQVSGRFDSHLIQIILLVLFFKPSVCGSFSDHRINLDLGCVFLLGAFVWLARVQAPRTASVSCWRFSTSWKCWRSLPPISNCCTNSALCPPRHCSNHRHHHRLHYRHHLWLPF